MITRRRLLLGGLGVLATKAAVESLPAILHDPENYSVAQELTQALRSGGAWLLARQDRAGWWITPARLQPTLLGVQTLYALAGSDLNIMHPGESAFEWLRKMGACALRPATLEAAALLVYAGYVLGVQRLQAGQMRELQRWFPDALEERSPAEWPQWWRWVAPTAAQWHILVTRQDPHGGWSVDATAAVLNGLTAQPLGRFREQHQVQARALERLTFDFQNGRVQQPESVAATAVCFQRVHSLAPRGWARTMALELLNTQNSAGAWGNWRSTCFALQACRTVLGAL